MERAEIARFAGGRAILDATTPLLRDDGGWSRSSPSPPIVAFLRGLRLFADMWMLRERFPSTVPFIGAK